MENRNYKTWEYIGLNIIYYRKLKGITQMELAEKCGISRTHMQRIESANSAWSGDLIMDIANVLEIPLYKLFQFRD